MYFMPEQLHIMREVNHKGYLIIHFEEKGLWREGARIQSGALGTR